ncbi:hypothetical protein P2H44_12975 [Albimonas sp. CAU 1670]|uniref:hypothetical protein n=1 Tax=Albimonas sp. CAU 1670 TaxID=3032599 RepID=UPI0023DA9BA3|nr:hypothetical protein [Albimonas sp. CAU 1670]MDF2233466.1 hypothetical protein [Albimonas sp. CAU 1670]
MGFLVLGTSSGLVLAVAALLSGFPIWAAIVSHIGAGMIVATLAALFHARRTLRRRSAARERTERVQRPALRPHRVARQPEPESV